MNTQDSYVITSSPDADEEMKQEEQIEETSLDNEEENEIEIGESNEDDTNEDALEDEENEKTPEYNFKNMRAKLEEATRRREEIEREREEERKRVDELYQYTLSLQEENKQFRSQYEDFTKKKSKRYDEDDEDDEVYFKSLKDDDLAEIAHVKKYMSRLEKKIELSEKRREQERKENEERERLRKEAEIRRSFVEQYPDYYSVINKENLDKLEKLKPQLVATLVESTNLRAKGLATYDAIVEFVLKNKHNDEISRNKILAKKNLSKPKSLSQINKSKNSNSSLDKAFEAMTWSERKRERKRIQEEMKRAQQVY